VGCLTEEAGTKDISGTAWDGVNYNQRQRLRIKGGGAKAKGGKEGPAPGQEKSDKLKSGRESGKVLN
jgi:hypothetical protein